MTARSTSEPEGRDTLDTPGSSRVCPRCSAPADAQNLYCPGCGASFEATVVTTTARGPDRHLACESCGARLLTGGASRSQTCPFCASSAVVEAPAADAGRAPEFVLPFAIPPDDARAAFERWLAERSMFRPGDLARAAAGAGLSGVYLPFWSFSLHAESDWQADIGEHWYRTEMYTTRVGGKTVVRTRRVQMTEWWPLAGRYRRFHDDYLVSGSKGLAQADADRIQPFRLEGLQRYHARFLAGWSCEEFSVDETAALAAAHQEFGRRQQHSVAAFLPGDTHRDLRMSNRFSRIESTRTLLPIFIFSYRWGTSVHRFLINGQTGRSTGTKPLSAARIALAVVAAAALAAAVVAVAMFVAR